MPAELPILEMASRAQWRAWLARRHASSPGVWVVFHKAHTGVKGIGYEDMVRQALCFGWIDSLVKRLDEDRYAIKVTPRKPSSKWSAKNRQRYAELAAEGLLAAPGLATAPTSVTYGPKPKIPALPGYIAKAFRSNPRAWTFFQTLAPTYRRNFVAWIHTAKRPETRARRIEESIELLAAGRKLGLK